MGDNGFTFNRQFDKIEIISYKSYKKPKKDNLTLIQKNWNRKLSQMRVMVENLICHIKM
jgi:hypothetical protein